MCTHKKNFPQAKNTKMFLKNMKMNTSSRNFVSLYFLLETVVQTGIKGGGESGSNENPRKHFSGLSTFNAFDSYQTFSTTP